VKIGAPAWRTCQRAHIVGARQRAMRFEAERHERRRAESGGGGPVLELEAWAPLGHVYRVLEHEGPEVAYRLATEPFRWAPLGEARFEGRPVNDITRPGWVWACAYAAGAPVVPDEAWRRATTLWNGIACITRCTVDLPAAPAAPAGPPAAMVARVRREHGQGAWFAALLAESYASHWDQWDGRGGVDWRRAPEALALRLIGATPSAALSWAQLRRADGTTATDEGSLHGVRSSDGGWDRVGFVAYDAPDAPHGEVYRTRWHAVLDGYDGDRRSAAALRLLRAGLHADARICAGERVPRPDTRW
jgi:hypothetical protein